MSNPDATPRPPSAPVAGEDGASVAPAGVAPVEDVPPVSAELLVDGDLHPELAAQREPGEPLPDELVDELAERRYPSTIGGAIYLAVLAVVAAGMGMVVVGEWRTGVRTIAGALVFASAVRLTLRPRDAGMLAVRNKVVDACVLTGLGAALIFLAGSIPDQP